MKIIKTENNTIIIKKGDSEIELCLKDIQSALEILANCQLNCTPVKQAWQLHLDHIEKLIGKY